MSGGRPEKRARVEEPPAAAGAFDVLPDAVLGDVFKALGPQEGWRLRRVSRRWRRVVEETEWASFELRIRAADVDVEVDRYLEVTRGAGQSSEEASKEGDENVYRAISALFETRKLRLSAGASVSLRPELSRLLGLDYESDAEHLHRRRVEAACGLLRAIVRSHSGSAQPREVSIELLHLSNAYDAPTEIRRPSIGEYFSGRTSSPYRYLELWEQVGRGFLSNYLLEALRALRPPEGAASALDLESISVSFSCSSATGRKAAPATFLQWPAAAELRAALAPFSKLRSLSLTSGSPDKGFDQQRTAAIADACPLLQSIRLRSKSESATGVLTALAPLAHLQQIVLISTSAVFQLITGGLAALADGAAGKSLRSIAFVTEEDRYEHVWTSPDDGLLALSRMPKLESIRPLRLDADKHSPAAVVALGRIAGLRDALFHIERSGDDAKDSAFLRALAEAISGLPRLSRLGIEFNSLPPPELTAALLSSDGVRRALVDLTLRIRYDRLLNGAVAESILALPSLESLHLDCRISPRDIDVDPTYLRPYEVLAGLRPEVALHVDLGRRYHWEGKPHPPPIPILHPCIPLPLPLFLAIRLPEGWSGGLARGLPLPAALGARRVGRAGALPGSSCAVPAALGFDPEEAASRCARSPFRAPQSVASASIRRCKVPAPALAPAPARPAPPDRAKAFIAGMAPTVAGVTIRRSTTYFSTL
eukprot:tig00000057_g46.t1